MPVRKILSTLLVVFAYAAGALAEEQLNICVIRVEFQEDNNELTTGNGKFVYDTTGVTPNTVDPPPHDRSYFQDQLIAVRNYYHAASKGNFEISGSVFPLAQRSAYLLPNDMGYYSPNTTDEENDQQLAQLFIDAVTAADADPDLNFSDFDVVAIFHAGVGKDIDLGFDETPQDIPSLYITPEFLKRALGADFNGITVDNGAYVIDRAMLLPETESQEGLELALTGIFAANIGSHIGLYDLFSPSTQLSGIGTFGLMDSGLFNMFGLAPAMPCAFSRVIKNWDNPVVLTAPEPNLELNRFEGAESNGTTVYQIPINSTEHYLVEYRGERQINVDSVLFVMSEGREDLPTYLEVLRAYIPDRITISDSTGVLLKMDNYDWGLPGAGILIWHVDEAVIREKGPENRINDDRSNRAVDVEEADGSQDIGYSYSLVEAGFQSELGTWLDFWFDGNPSPLYTNEFSGKSAPNTFSNRNFAPSNIIVDAFSDNYSASMRFSFHRDFYKTGFPVHLNLKDTTSQTGDIYFVPVESVGKPAVFVNSGDGDVFAATDNGKGLFDQQHPRIISGTGEKGLSIVFADTNTNGAYDMLITVTSAGLVSGYRLIDQDNDGSPDSLFTVDLQRSVRARPVVRYPYVFIGTENGEICRLHFDGQIDQTFQTGAPISGFVVFGPEDFLVVPADGDGPYLPPNVIDMDSDGLQDTVYFEDARDLKITSGTLNVTIRADEKPTGQPAFADLDLDGLYEILFTTPKGVHAYKYNGARVTNFPLFPVLGEGEYALGTPLVLDLDADGSCDVAFATTAGQIYVYNQNGDLLQGLPFSTGSAITGSPAAGDIDGDLRFELFGVNGSDLYAWEFPGELDETISVWTQAAYDPSNNHLIDRFLEKVPSAIEELLPSARAFVYPNPNTENYTNIRYYLNKDARVTVSIFDLAGDLVTRFNGPGNGAVDNEIRWQLDGVSSGVYLCRIEAAAGNEQAVQLIKVMVIK